MKEILLVYDRSEADAATLLEMELTRAFADKGEIRVTTSGNEENARSHLPGNFSLVITALYIRKSPLAPLSIEDEEGIELVRWMRFNRMNAPTILVIPMYTQKLCAAGLHLENCHVIPSGANMVQAIVALAVQLVYEKPAKSLDVEIHLRSRTDWGYKLIGKGFTYYHEHYLTVDESTIKDLDMLSRVVSNSEDWQEVLERIGKTLLEVISRDHSFPFEMGECLSLVGDETNARIRFVVKPELHNLLLEAVWCPPQARDQYWMLFAPVYRRLLVDQSATVPDLFEGGRPISCLIIDATTSGYVEDLGLVLMKLKKVSDECDWVYNWLKTNRSRFNIGEVSLLKVKQGNTPLAQGVKEALESRDWSIVHYAGHSYARNDAAYIFLPSATEGPVERVDLKRFSDWLRRVSFTYFSSCDSGAGSFVFELAKRKVSDILAYRWEIDDTLAFEHAKEFYEQLFGSRSLERAYLTARKRMHDLHPDDRIWAAPILIKQLGNF